MATKKTASKAKTADKPAPKVPAKAVSKPAPPKAEPKTPAKPAAKAPAKAPTKAAAAPKAAAKAPAPAAKKAEPKVAAAAKSAAAPAAGAKASGKAPAPKAGKPGKDAAVQAPPLLPEVLEAPSPKPAPKAKKAEAAAVHLTPGLSPHAEAIQAAIQAGRAVELIFADENANPPRTFEPRQLIYDVFTQAWFAWGWDRRYNAERHHRLDLLAQVNPVEGPGRAAQGPYKDGTPANLIGGWLGGEPIPVKATLMKQWIFAVKQAPAPFPDFRMEDAPDGKASVSFTATDLRAIARWCMQFGDGIQVLEPQRLIDRIKQVGIAWGGKPVAAAAAPAPKAAPAAPPAPSAGHRADRDRERPDRDRGGHRRERGEHKDEPRHGGEHRSEHRDEPRRERESPKDEGKGKPAKVEVRVERL